MQAVDHDDETGFLALQKLFDDHACAARVVLHAVAVGLQHVVDGGMGFVGSLRHHHALACGQAISLDDDGRAVLVHIGMRCRSVFEGGVGGGGNVVPRHEVLREGFGAFELGGGARRTENFQAAGAKAIDDACGQRRFGPDHGVGDFFAHAERGQLFGVGHLQVLQPGVERGAAVAGRDIDLLYPRRLRQLPGDGVFTSAGADDEEFHGECGGLGEGGVVIDLLHIVKVFQGVDEFLHLFGVVARQLDCVVGAHGDDGEFRLQRGGFERGAHRLELGRRSEHFDRAVVIRDHVVRSSLQRHFHHLVFRGAGREHELAAMPELEGHRALGAQITAVLGQRMAHFGHGAHAVVGQAVDDDRRTAHAIAFVANFFVMHAFERAGGLVDVFLHRIGGHIRRLGLVDRQAQSGIGVGVAAAQTGCGRDFTNDLGPDLAAFFVLTAFAVLDIGPFGMSGHGGAMLLRMPCGRVTACSEGVDRLRILLSRRAPDSCPPPFTPRLPPCPIPSSSPSTARCNATCCRACPIATASSPARPAPARP